jgi:hypothetical protein
MTRLRFAILYLLSSILAATGADVAFYLQSFTGRPVNYPITLTPYAPLAVDSTNLITATTWRLTPSNGVAYASNILAGDYTMSIELTGARAVITVPDTNGLLDAASLVSVNPATATGLAYSKTASDARYVHGVAAGENATASTNAGVVTISAEPGGGWSNILGTAIYAVPGALPWDSEDIAFVGESGTNLVIRWGDGSGIYAPLFTGDGSGLTNLPVTGGSVSNLPPAQSPMWLTSRPRGIRTNTPAWGMKPAMGWNPWNTYYCEVNQGALVGAALAMKTNGLAAAGYTNYIATDDPWQIGRDGSGNPTVDPVKWPNGFPWLRNFLNTNGFGFAVWTSMRTYGQAQSTSCGGSYLHGSGFYEARDAWFYVTNFGVNAIKIDNLGASNMSNSLVYFTSAVEDACNATGREVYLMTVGYGGGLAEDVYWPWAPLVNQARTGHDIRPVWNYEVGSLVGVRQQLRKFDIGAIYHQPGFFNDPDMMVVGVTNTLHGTNAFLSYDENLSHFQLWCIMGAPLMLGCNPTNLSAPLMAIVTNRSLINVDQDSGGFAGRVIFSQQERGGPFEIWSKPAGTLDSGTNYVLLLNNSDTTNWFYAYWAKLGFGTNVTVNDLSQSLSSATRETRSDFTRARLAPRQSIMYRVVSTPARDMSNREWLDNLTLRKDTTNALHVDTLTATNFRGYSHAAFTVGSATTPTVAYVATNHNFTGTITGNGSGLTNLNAVPNYLTNVTTEIWAYETGGFTFRYRPGFFTVDTRDVISFEELLLEDGADPAITWQAGAHRLWFDWEIYQGSLIAENTVTASNFVATATPGFIGNGASLTGLNADNIASGTVNYDRLPITRMQRMLIADRRSVGAGWGYTNTVSDTVTYTNLIPAGSMGTNGTLRITLLGNQAGVTNCSAIVRLGGVTVWDAYISTTEARSWLVICELYAHGTEIIRPHVFKSNHNSRSMFGGASIGSSGDTETYKLATVAVDQASANALTVSFIASTRGDPSYVELNVVNVEVIPGP